MTAPSGRLRHTLACHSAGSLFPVLFWCSELALVAVAGRVVACALSVAFDPCVPSMAWTMLLPGLFLWTMRLPVLASMIHTCRDFFRQNFDISILFPTSFSTAHVEKWPRRPKTRQAFYMAEGKFDMHAGSRHSLHKCCCL
jgi:hypothetical protein